MPKTATGFYIWSGAVFLAATFATVIGKVVSLWPL